MYKLSKYTVQLFDSVVLYSHKCIDLFVIRVRSSDCDCMKLRLFGRSGPQDGEGKGLRSVGWLLYIYAEKTLLQ
jgi:hypothetical protein